MMKRFTGVLFLIACLLAFSACPRSVPDYFAFRRDGFRAEVRGTLGDRDFCAKVETERGSDGWFVRVEYLTPVELERTEIQAACNERGEGIGDAEIVRGESRFSVSADTLRGLLLPATTWLSCDEIVAVQKGEEGYTLSLANGVCLQIGEDGRPMTFTSDQIRMEVVWLESTAF